MNFGMIMLNQVKYEDNAKLCYINTDTFIIHIKTKDFYKDIANDVEKWFDTSNYDHVQQVKTKK